MLTNSQKFLRSRALVDRLIAASSIQPRDLVLDLGAGHGIITERLVQIGCRVIAVEKDPVLAARLRARFTAVDVRRVDILELVLPSQPYTVFANIPFDTTTAIVQHLTRAACPPEDAYLVVQREAAERLVGAPRGTLVAASLAPWFEASVVHRFRRTDFAPMPRVEVVMLRLRKRGPPLVMPEHASLFRGFVVFLFTARQRSLANRLAQLLGRRRAAHLLRHLGLAPTSTPASLAPDEWLDLFSEFQTAANPRTQLLVSEAERRLRNQQRHLRKLHRTRMRGMRRPWRLDSSCRPPPAQEVTRLISRGGLASVRLIRA
jgi:23S rRNA (adenine-N6)-dimethyltransferase